MARTTGTVRVIPVPAPADDGTPAAATELAALEAERDEKRRLLERAARAAVAGGPGLPPGCDADDLPALSTGARQSSYSALRDSTSDQLGHNGRDRVDRLRHDD